MSTHSIDPTTTPQPRILEVRTKILKKNDELAVACALSFVIRAFLS